VADHPLRPATDRRLGRPLPHQQPNRTQAAPKAHHCFVPQDICGISPSFPGLSPTSGHVPTRYAPVRRCRCRPRDLHVLSMPPAFALSQDQTLRFIHQPSINPASSEPPRTHLSQQSPSHPSKPAKTSPHHPRHQQLTTTSTRAPTAHPTPGQHHKPSRSSPTRPQHQPSAQHTATTGQPKPPIRTAKINKTSETDSSVKEQHQPSPSNLRRGHIAPDR
jgi:hypothetical protein